MMEESSDRGSIPLSSINRSIVYAENEVLHIAVMYSYHTVIIHNEVGP